MTEIIDQKERGFIDNHPILKDLAVNRKFIFRNYEKCYYFIKDILESESITVREHRIIKDLMKFKNRNETRGKHLLPFITGFFSLRLFFKSNSYIIKIIILFGYYYLLFDMSYNLGLHMSNFILFPRIFNIILKINDGNSIQSLQTKLFIKKCLLDQYREDNRKIEKPSWRKSFIVNEVVIKNALNAKKSMFLKSV